MTNDDLLEILNGIGFTERYWALCDAHPFRDTGQIARSFTKAELIGLFKESGPEPRYDARDRSVTMNLGPALGFQWEGIFCGRRSGSLELLLIGNGPSVLGSNFAVLAYDAKRALEPGFSRNAFSGPVPYPRPSHNGDADALNAIAGEFVAICRDAMTALQRRSLTAPA